jgi:pimeloyl-ACP methyl ester carboxylesterase
LHIRDGDLTPNAMTKTIVASALAGAFVVVLCSLPSRTVAAPKRALAAATTAPGAKSSKSEDASIRTFRVSVPQNTLDELRRRVLATRWPDKETVSDQSQGIPLAKIQPLMRYWGTDYDWRKAEARLNALPQYVTRIDGLNIHFIHVRSRHPSAMPLLLMHGWPGSVLELAKVIGPLTDPTAHGGRAEEAFDVVIPSMPGYGFSERPQSPGWGPERIARAWDVLIKRLGYSRYVAQGGDWGALLVNAMAREAPAGLLGVHSNMPATVPADVAKALADGSPAPAGLSASERAAFDQLQTFYKNDTAYGAMMHTRPQTVAYGLTDSPVGLGAWMLGHPGFKQWTRTDSAADHSKSMDEVLDDITLYWITNTAASSARLYWENQGGYFNAADQKTQEIALPVAITVFPDEIYRAPESWARRAYPKLSYFHQVDQGGHFAAWEQPELFAAELRAAFRSLRQK